MNSEHEVFLQGIEQGKKLKVKFFCRKRQREVESLCAPLHYSKGPTISNTDEENELECYYFWDCGAEKGNNFLALSPSEILDMKLTDDVFHVREFYGPVETGTNPEQVKMGNTSRSGAI